MEDTLIVFIIFGCLVAVVKLALDYARDRERMKASAGSGSSLTTSELKGLMQEAVEEALDERFGQLERRLEKLQEPRLMPANTEKMDVSEAKPESPPIPHDRESML